MNTIELAKKYCTFLRDGRRIDEDELEHHVTIYEFFPEALEAFRAECLKRQWQPIETAPKGDKGYAWMQLAWGPEEDKTTGDGMYANGKFYAVATFHCIGQDRRYQMREIEVYPTHWMPLPAAPESKT